MNEVPQNVGPGGLNTVDRLDVAGLTLDLRREELRDAAGARIELRNRSFGVLRHLATNAGRVELQKVDGASVMESPLKSALREAGFTATHRSLVAYGRRA